MGILSYTQRHKRRGNCWIEMLTRLANDFRGGSSCTCRLVTSLAIHPNNVGGKHITSDCCISQRVNQNWNIFTHLDKIFIFLYNEKIKKLTRLLICNDYISETFIKISFFLQTKIIDFKFIQFTSTKSEFIIIFGLPSAGVDHKAISHFIEQKAPPGQGHHTRWGLLGNVAKGVSWSSTERWRRSPLGC